MIGDVVHIKPHHLPPARRILELISEPMEKSRGVFTITIGGESGSGKSTLGLAIRQLLETAGRHCFIFHIDDYFKLPPRDNHNNRLKDLGNVGPGEVDLDLMQQHIYQMKEGAPEIEKPLIHYKENRIRRVTVDVDNVEVIIAEGTYTTLLDGIDCKVFMLRNYLDTYENRVERARDPIIPFNEKVLEIEHTIIKEHAAKADILVDKDYNIHSKKTNRTQA
ncbi:MAG TPA: hypothetical protein VJ964_17860 [Balneolaceae bacterium]|nr:hypothetical protein [Balneolaceae bacterium]